MTDLYCPLTDLPTTMCAHCLGKEKLSPRTGLTIHKSIEARRRGCCGSCEEWTIRPGDTIYLATDENDEDFWIGDCCR